MLAAATVQAQNIAEQLYAADDREALLPALGFSEQEDGWLLAGDDYTIRVVLSEEERAGGTLHLDRVRIEAGEETLLTLPCVRYEEVAA